MNGVLICGEALGAREEADGAPFRPHADAGSVLQDVIRLSGYKRESFVLWNVCGCRPTNNELAGAPYEQEAIAHCRQHLDAVVEKYKPRAILALGSIALRTLTGMSGKKQGISLLRGFVLQSPQYDIPVVASFHPSFLRRGAMNLKGVLIRDLKLAVDVAAGRIVARPTDYQLYPTPEEAHAYLGYVKSLGHDTALAYDIETRESTGNEEEDLEWTQTEIVQIQFSHEAGQAIVFPWMGEYVEVAKGLLALPVAKYTFNGFGFDEPVLRAHGVEINGESHDMMWAWHHMQPDLPRNLQFVTSFFAPELSPWKHLSGTDLAFYGAVDVDALQRIGPPLFADMKAKGVWRGYERHVLRLRPILRRMEERGLPIDREAQQKFRAECDLACRQAFGEMQVIVPDDWKNCLPKEGYVNEKVAEKQKASRVLEPGEAWGTRGFVPKEPKGKGQGCALHAGSGGEADERDRQVGGEGAGSQELVERQVRVQPFVPSSSQLMSYIKRRGHRIPKIPGEDKETTGKMGLQRLAASTRDPLYPKVIEYREYEKIISTYIDGWKCGADGRVHTTFTFAPATGQLSSRNPNVQNVPRRTKLADEFRRMIVARPGHKLVSFDYKSFHALTLGFEAEDADYMRAARTDIHSIIAMTQILKVESFDRLWAMSDADLIDRTLWWRANTERTWETSDGPKTFEWIRDFRAKPAILGYGFGLGAGKLYEMNLESFSSEREAKQVLLGIDAIFPKTAKFRDNIRALAQRQKFLRSRHGYIRWFWDVMTWDARAGRSRSGADSEKVIAYLPANDAFGVIKDVMLKIDARGWAEKYNLLTQTHDDLLFECPDGLVDECMTNVKGVMEAPCKVLTHPVLAPEGLWCEVSVKVGRDWGSMKGMEGLWKEGEDAGNKTR